MTDFDRLIDRYRQFGGIKLAWAYMKMGLTWPLLQAIFSCVVKGRSLKNVYPVIQSRTQPMLVDMFSPIAHSLNEKYSGDRCAYTGNTSGERKKVWFCWLQGMEHSPALVKACLESLRERLTDADIVIIDGESYKEWIGLPEYVTEKYRNGKIPPALFSDMIRLELLAEYGGVWIDSTVLCTVPSSDEHGQHAPSWREITEAELFVFQYTKPGCKWSGSISNWFIGANRDNIIIKMVRDMLYEYWRVYDVTIDYYIFHLFFAIAARECPDMIRRMPYGWSIPCITLGEHLEEDFSENKWEKFTRKVHWHKLNYRNEKRMKGNKKSYYNYIIDRYIPYKKLNDKTCK